MLRNTQITHSTSYHGRKGLTSYFLKLCLIYIWRNEYNIQIMPKRCTNVHSKMAEQIFCRREDLSTRPSSLDLSERTTGVCIFLIILILPISSQWALGTLQWPMKLKFWPLVSWTRCKFNRAPRCATMCEQTKFKISDNCSGLFFFHVKAGLIGHPKNVLTLNCMKQDFSRVIHI